jgi:hypothetical protein
LALHIDYFAVTRDQNGVLLLLIIDVPSGHNRFIAVATSVACFNAVAGGDDRWLHAHQQLLFVVSGARCVAVVRQVAQLD